MDVTGFPLFSSSARLREIVATMAPIPCQILVASKPLHWTLFGDHESNASILTTSNFKEHEISVYTLKWRHFDTRVQKKCTIYHMAKYLLKLRVRVIGASGNIFVTQAVAHTLVKFFQNFSQPCCVKIHKSEKFQQIPPDALVSVTKSPYANSCSSTFWIFGLSFICQFRKLES